MVSTGLGSGSISRRPSPGSASPAAPEVDRPLTPKRLREVALELRRHAARHADTEAKMTAFLDRADALRAEARAIERKRLTAAERKRDEKGMRGR